MSIQFYLTFTAPAVVAWKSAVVTFSILTCQVVYFVLSLYVFFSSSLRVSWGGLGQVM
jgi:hypothetical protein